MPKYKITIEFETDKPIKFPADHYILFDMQTQLESLEDGSYDEHMGDERLKVTRLPGKIEEIDKGICPTCGYIYCYHTNHPLTMDDVPF